ncbi:MAG: GIY-YIG nuclease family protein [Flavobacteriales bacterium]|nr:GIY-YIG nuclease family protein [Flavobacteriales bacterium]
MYTVYILYSNSKDKYYVGHTSDIEDRLTRHNTGRNKSTKYGVSWELVYKEAFSTKSEAYQRELEIKKKKSRVYIEKLIKG